MKHIFIFLILVSSLHHAYGQSMKERLEILEEQIEDREFEIANDASNRLMERIERDRKARENQERLEQLIKENGSNAPTPPYIYAYPRVDANNQKSTNKQSSADGMGSGFVFGIVLVIFGAILFLFKKFVIDSQSKDSPSKPINSHATQNSRKPSSTSNEDGLWSEALDEFESRRRKKSLYAKLFAQFNGNQDLIKSAYLKTRFAELEAEAQTANKASEYKTKFKKFSHSEALLGSRVCEIFKVSGIDCVVFENGQAAYMNLNGNLILYEDRDKMETAALYYKSRGMSLATGKIRAIRTSETNSTGTKQILPIQKECLSCDQVTKFHEYQGDWYCVVCGRNDVASREYLTSINDAVEEDGPIHWPILSASIVAVVISIWLGNGFVLYGVEWIILGVLAFSGNMKLLDAWLLRLVYVDIFLALTSPIFINDGLSDLFSGQSTRSVFNLVVLSMLCIKLFIYLRHYFASNAQTVAPEDIPNASQKGRTKKVTLACPECHKECKVPANMYIEITCPSCSVHWTQQT